MSLHNEIEFENEICEHIAAGSLQALEGNT